jgi:DNA-binding transcriptional regulator YiaG
MRTKPKSDAMKYLERVAGRPLTLGGVIHSIRRGKEMSQSVFARKLSISASHLCDIEKGCKVVGPERAARYAKILGCNPEQFVRLLL